jgi:hypothetical protein
MRLFSSILLLAAAVAEMSCYPVKAYHLAPAIVTLTPTITLAYIEFDDNGEMYEQRSGPVGTLGRPQLDQTIQKLKDLEAASSAGINVMLFVHGWKNNAGNSNNVAGFQAFLQTVYNSYGTTPNAAPLMGIYIGWRGASVKVAKDFSYWSRSNATLRVAGPHLEEALYRIIRTVKGPEPVVGQTSNLILIGHSFGGRVLEKAMTSYLEGLMVGRHGNNLESCVAGPDPAKSVEITGPLPNLTVLLNEAAPATDAKQLLEILKCHGVQNKRDADDFPLLLSITSAGDAATSIALPIGQTLSRVGMKARNYGDSADPREIPNQSTYFTHSAANIPALHSHELRDGNCLANETPVPFITTPILGRYRLCAVPQSGKGTPYWNHTPYWISGLPVSIVPDHSNIFRPELFSYLSAFLPTKQSLQAPKIFSQKHVMRIQ